jgi:eukaryotic-like serine/threonine-protein kinase
MNELALFEAAIAITDPVQRAALLDRECTGKPELRARLEELLSAHGRSNPLLDRPLVGDVAIHGPAEVVTADAVTHVEAEGTIVAGRYKLLQQIGEGGMGTVWMADQTEPVKRRVAVKLIRVERGQSKTILSRFEAERQAIALMDHPHIARLLDAGTTDTGAPYFVMELVKGVPLTDFCDAHKLSIPERLHLFMQVCAAVQHAHQKGVIHRDLKPSNILVESHDGKPVPKIIDFGLAKATTGLQLTERTLFTAFGSVMGTPLYMAPEQASASAVDVDTRADVFALGIILYELLTGTTPITRETLKKAALDEMLRLIREQEVPTPSSRLSSSETAASVAANRHTEPAKLGRFVKGDLDWIVLRALAKERDRRYETANGFAKDIERFLNHEPVEACPPSTAYKLRKFARRNKTLLRTAAAFVLLLTVGAVVSTWQAIRAMHAEAAANASADQARLNAEEAEFNAQQSRTEANAKAVALKAEQQARADETKARQQAFAALRSMTADVVETKFTQGAMLTEDDRAFLRGIISQYDAFAAIKGDDINSRAVQADGRFRVGNVRRTLGELHAAQKDYDQAVSILTQLAEDFPSRPEFRYELARCQINRGNLLHDTGRLKEEEQDRDQAMSILKKLAADFPTQPEYRSELASSHNNRGLLLSATGRLPEAERDYDQAVSIHKQLVAEFPNRPEFRRQMAIGHDSRGALLAATGRLPEAERDYDQAVSIRKQLAEDFPNRPEFRQELAKSYNNRGILVYNRGRRPEAEKDFDEAMSIQKQLAEDFPSRPAFRHELALSHNNRGILLSKKGRVNEAEQDYDRAVSIQKQLAADFPSRPEYRSELASSHMNRGALLNGRGRRNEAEQDYDRAVSLSKQLSADFPNQPEFRFELAKCLTNRGNLLRFTGRLQEAKQDYDQAVNIQKQLATDFPNQPEYRQELARSHTNRGDLLGAMGRLPEVEQDFNQVVSIYKELVADFPNQPEFRQELAKIHNSRGLLLTETGRLQDAEKDFDQALSIQKQLTADFPNKPDLRNDLAWTCVGLANLRVRQSNWAAAKRLLLEGRPHHLAALKTNPRHPIYRHYYRNHLNALTRVHAGLLEQEDAARTAETCRDLGWDAVADAYNAACFLSRCIPIVAKHDKLDDKQRNEAVQFYGDAAMKLLREAVSKGFKDVVHMKKDADLNPLRQREDFQKLVAELEGKRN